ncbi:hypothetical protein [Neomoorella humiferrea]|uniref:hypothetical protein n=1 Tax=Neomoorella humiferrea TaxID=676965 RepID=UPI0030D2E66E
MDYYREDLFDEEKIVRYAESLKEKGLEKEADYVLEQFRTLGREAGAFNVR